MQHNEGRITQVVSFGRPNGVQRLGLILNIGPKNFTLRHVPREGEASLGKFSVSPALCTAIPEKGRPEIGSVPASVPVIPPFRRAPKPPASEAGFMVGQEVLFGRENGEKTRGRVVKVNPTRLKIEQLEARGGHAIGTKWNVPPKFVSPV